MALIFQDDFAGTVIDTGKWTVTNPSGRFSQNNALIISQSSHANISRWANSLISILTATSGTAVAQGTLNYNTASSPPSDTVPIFALYKDSNNYACIINRGGGSGEFFRFQIVSGGSTVYDADSTITADNTLWKITYDISGHDIKFWYWNGSAWSQQGTTQNINLGATTIYAGFSFQDVSSWTGTAPLTFDDFYYSNADYSTQYPTTVSNNGNMFLVM